MTERVSLCLIVRDEAHQLADCLAPLAGLFHEVVVVDTGSTDSTREVAESLGALVREFAWCDSFSAARNAAIETAGGDWILWLDADDRLAPADRDRLAALLAGLGPEPAVYMMRSRSRGATPGADVVVEHARLFPRRDDIRFVYRVHEQVAPAALKAGCRLRSTDILIEHVGYNDEVLHEAKKARNLRLLEMDLADNPRDPFLLFYTGWHHFREEDPARAVDLLERAQKAPRPAPHGDPPVAFVAWLLAQSLRRTGQPGEALGTCVRALERCADDPDLLLLAAILHEEGGDAGAALSCLEHLARQPAVASLAHTDGGLRRCIGHQRAAALHAAAGRDQAAVSAWRVCNTERPDYLPAWVAQVDHLIARSDMPALQVLLDASTADAVPGLPRLLVRGRMLTHAGATREALQTLEQATRQYPDEAAAHELLAHALLREGQDLPRAVTVLRRVLELAPDNAAARHNLAVLEKRGV